MISIIIPNTVNMECAKTSKYPYYEKSLPLKECIQSIKKQNYKDYEIIFTEWSSIGNFYSLDIAWRRAKGDIILFFCPRAILKDSNALTNLNSIFIKTNADAVSLSSVTNKKLMGMFIWLLCVEYEAREDYEGWVDAAPIIYLAIRKDVLEKMGGLNFETSIRKNPLFDSGFIDWDFCGSLRESGYKIWHTNKIKLNLLYRTGIYGYFKKQFHHAWFRVAYYKKHKKIKEGYSNFSFFYPNIFKYYKKVRDLRILLLIPISIFRDIVWFFGALKGIWDFYLR